MRNSRPGAPDFLAGVIALALALLPAQTRAAAPENCAPPPVAGSTVNVKDKGAVGDGRADDTAAIQAAIDAVAGTGGTVLVPDGVYMVSAVENKLRLKSDMTLKLADGAVLKAIPNDETHYAVLTISGAANVWVTGGTLEGERNEHRGKSGEWGMGVRIEDGAKNVTIIGVTAKKMWGDGFYVQDAEDVRFCGVTADANRRQGLSIIDADGLLVLNSTFKNTGGTRPGAGIDLEPDKNAQRIANIRIENSKFFDNAGGGILVAGKRARVSKVEMTRNTFRGNRPFVVENAPGIADAICGNRQKSVQTETSGGFNAYAEPVEVVALQNDCGESGFVIDRGNTKKKKKKAN
ncbi:MAG: glycosyl hydrolase family 28-related protein [Methyloceanibacter sp.]